MKPIPLTETQMAELFRIRAENETLRTRLAELENQEPVAHIVKTDDGEELAYSAAIFKYRMFNSEHIIADLFAAPVVIPDAEKLKAEIADLQVFCDRLNDRRNSLVVENMSLKTELEAARKDAEWKPIETAPKTGRELILLITPSNFPQVAYSNTWWTSGFSAENKPTHWKPLPAPTAIEQAKGGVK